MKQCYSLVCYLKVLHFYFDVGASPYSEQKIGASFDSFVHYLKEGNRLAKPVGCPTIL